MTSLSDPVELSIQTERCGRCQTHYFAGATHECRAEPLRFDRLIVDGPATYRLTCHTCNLVADVRTSFNMRRFEGVSSEPPADPTLAMFDLASGDAEKREHNRQVDAFERELRAMAERDLVRGGCTHVPPR